MSDVTFQGSRVLVTGAGSGIGRATAIRCAGLGAEVISVDIDPESAGRTATECEDEGAISTAHACDVAESPAVDALAVELEAAGRPVDVLINNAGVGVGGPFLDNTPEDWEWLRGVNLDGVVNGCRSFGRGMVDRGHGHVVNIASAAAYTANRNMAAYCTSKAAVMMLSQCLRADWSGSGVGVSVVCPGLIKTPIPTRTRYRGALAAKRERAIRAFRYGHSPDLVAKAIVSAVEKDRAIVPVGIESTLAFRVLRIAPGSVQGLFAKAGMP